MFRGEFIRGDGLVIPNNITTYGANLIFELALRDSGYALHLALANCNPSETLGLAALGEPTIGVNGYARAELTRDATGWPVDDTFNGETFFETREVVFEAVGGDFSAAASRLALVNHATSVAGPEVVSLSAAFPDAFTITPTTPLVDRTFKYRIYGR